MNSITKKELLRQSSIGTSVLFLSLVFLTSGYSFGYGEQMLLSVKGISWADPNAFRGDWFNNHAPQPHVLFDLITYLGEKIHFLDGVYFLYYLASCFLFAAGTAILADRWLSDRFKYLQHLVNALSVIGPYFVLGTFLNIHQQAVPNMAGGCIAYFAIACLLTQRDSWAAIAIVLASLFHLQHGIAIASVAILFVILQLVDKRALLLASSTVALFISVSIALYRGLLSGSSEVANQLAETGSTGHFNVEAWPRSEITSGLLFLLIACCNFLLPDSAKKKKTTFLALVIIAMAPVIGIASDLYNIEPFQSMARSFFVYRYSMILAPFACWFIVRTLSNAGINRKRVALTSALFFIFSYQKFFQTTFTALPQFGSLYLGLMLLVTVLVERISVVKPKIRTITSVFILSSVFVIATNVSVNQFGSRWPTLGLSSTDDAVTLSRSMATSLGSNDVLATDPSIPWLRPFTRRAIVVDCKGIPYGGNPWYEYVRRLEALGVSRPDQCVGYKQLSLQQILRLPTEVGATTILLLPDDAAYTEARETLPIRWTGNQVNPWIIFELPRAN